MRKKLLVPLFVMLFVFVLLFALSSCDLSGEGELEHEQEQEEIIGVEGLEYILSNDGSSYAIKSIGTCNLSEITLPTEYNGLPVTAINTGAFSYSGIEKIIVPDGYTGIYNLAFRECRSLTSISLPDGMLFIGPNAFVSCTSLTEVKLPSTLTSIGAECFKRCTSLSSITIPSSVSFLGSKCFAECGSLTSVKLGDCIKDFNADAFENTPIMSDPKNVESGITYIGNYIVNVDLDAVPNELAIREGTVSINEEAFKNCKSITKITLPNTIKYIGKYAFYECSVKEINLPDSIECIGDGAFANCAVASEYVGDCRYIGNHLISCYVKSSSVSVREGTITIAYGAITTNGSLSTVRLPKSLKNISDDKLFDGSVNKLQAIYVDEENENFVSIDGVLYDKSVNRLISCPTMKSGTLIIPDTVTTIGTHIFNSASCLSEIIIPKSVTTIHSGAFFGFHANDNGALYYCGSHNDWYQTINITISDLLGDSLGSSDIELYFYSDSGEAESNEGVWHYVNGVPTIWE